MKIDIQTSSKSYSVYIGNDCLHSLTTHLESTRYTKLLIITDETVGEMHLGELITAIPQSYKTETYSYIVPSGENAKQFSIYEASLSFALEKGLDRKSCIIAFGGGAVGDLAGFVSATYMRGIPFIQVPTTILAHDSAVGGKTGINHPLGKNMIGSFHQPEAVIYYTEFLKTLPEKEIRSGFAEAVKHALIADASLLEFIMSNVTDLRSIKDEHLNYILQRGIEIKANIVSQDERETGVRAFLNFGHTLGHVIESSAGYGKVSHGEAVMTGMVYALYLSKEMINLEFNITEFELFVKNLGYSLEIPERFEFDNAFASMTRDKKSYSNQPRFVLLEKIGTPIVKELDKERLEKVFSAFLSSTKLEKIYN
ncbi:3-dehydroquinate synthase [Lederbergia wuyishanensis]|uniref:3-dehydroquinate synthase n=1 Tax=Lederbergia wuyishanensis TaxID=1347903 RepID=A0ABU0D0X6_9BACI|nr:3-dehydroquinate synthase [Lederbergia wuyishanensis]MCJ8006673.1 3-dehydroquinate synthase [Lederbergia wuyishanensis]MDQ0342055.1 3-dehydroquinate synthase [Lederbergia wuyishanensis]